MTTLTFIKHSWTNSSANDCKASRIDHFDNDTLVTISLVASACCKERR